jgi:predicted ester cyclase
MTEQSNQRLSQLSSDIVTTGVKEAKMKKIAGYSKILRLTIGMLVLWAVMGCVSESVNKDADASSSEAQNKATMHHFIEAVYHQGNMGAFDELFSKNCVFHLNEKTTDSLETAKRQIRMIVGMYRDIQVTIDDIIAEGNLVAMRTTFKGVFRRNGKEMALPSITFCRFKDEKVVEIWRAFDNAYIFEQMGIKPPQTN